MRFTVRVNAGVRTATAGAAWCMSAMACHRQAPRVATAEPPVPHPAPVTPARVDAIPAPSVMARFRQSVDSMVNDAQFRNAHWGVLIVDPSRGDTLYAHNADKLFMPASNQKIVTGAVGLTQLGVDYRWRTPVLLRGVQRGATFTGDLVLVGRGDPSWSDALRSGNAKSAFDPIVDALARRGITRIAGKVLHEGEAFSDATTGFGWAFDDFDAGYSAAVDDLLMNEGFFTLRVDAGNTVAKRVRVSTRPTTTYPRVVVQAVARERADTAGPLRQIDAQWDSVANAVVVTGTLPVGDSTTMTLAYRHPADAVMAALREVLAERRIAVVPAPKVRRVERELPAHGVVAVRQADTLAVLQSPPLHEVLRRLEKPSQNQLAEMLFKTVALERTGFGRADSARAVVQRQLTDWGIAPEAIAVRDGSGLSRHDYVAPRTIVRILDVMRTAPSFDAFYAALPIAGVDGTISNRMKGTVAEGNVHAKTGTVDKARSLSGYVTTADGQLLIFSMLCNNYTVPTRAVERVQDAIAVQLAGMRLRDAMASSGR